MAYDTTLLETMPKPQPAEKELPACLRRDRLNAGYFAQFTVAQLATVIVLSIVFVWTSVHRLDPSFFGHLNFGRWIVEHRALPAVDPFMAANAEATIVPSVWLTQVLSYLVQQRLGYEGLVLAHALLVTLACGVMIAAIRARGVKLAWAIAGGAAYYLLSLPSVSTIGPHLFGIVGVPLALLACAQLGTKRAPLLWLPLIFALWANLHVSFAVGLAILALYATGATCDLFQERRNWRSVISDVRCIRLWSAAGLAMLGASLNPSGFHLFSDVLGFGRHLALESFTQWHAMSLISLSGVLFFVSVIGAIVSLRYSQRRWELADLLLLLVFSLATLSAMHMLAGWAAIFAWALSPYLVSIWTSKQSPATTEQPQAMRALIAVGFVFMSLLISPATNRLLCNQPRAVGAITSAGTPLYVADEIARRQLKGNVFAPAVWSDYLVWNQPDGLRPLAAAHVPNMNVTVRRDYQQLAAGSADWLQIADAHQLRYLVISKQQNKALAQLAVKYSGQPKSRASLLYQDQDSVLVELRPQP